MINTSCFTDRLKCTIGKSVLFIVLCQAVAVKEPQGWLFCEGLRILELTNKLLKLRKFVGKQQCRVDI